MPGRTPKPSGLRLVQGNPGKRPPPPNEPDPEYLADLSAPTMLSPAQAEIWNNLAPALRANKLLTVLDVQALMLLCIALQQHQFATNEIGDNKLIMKNAETGAFSPSPWVIIQSMSFKRAKLLLDAFGMTPAARTRVAVNPQGNLFDTANTPNSHFFTA
jgi:P27 family predicted phage terminase small subunit